SLAIGDGVLVVGAPNHDDSGAAYTFTHIDNRWPQTPQILEAPNAGPGDRFGDSVAIGGGENFFLIVGAPGEDGSGDGIDPPDDNGSSNSGAVYSFGLRAANPGLPVEWTQATRIKAPDSAAGDSYGTAVAIAKNVPTFVVGAPREDGDEGDGSGAAYVYTRLADGSMDIARIKAARPLAGANYGSAVALDGNGSILAVGAPNESSTAAGVDGSLDAPVSAEGWGAVDVVIRAEETSWSAGPLRKRYIKAFNPDEGDEFGRSLACSDSCDTLVVGAPNEDGNGTELSPDNDPGDNSFFNAGAAYLY
ncbi:MAG: hypothetical protein ABW171_12585, partial [Steroidobacter sp.]